MLDDFGLGPTLARYLDQFQESTGIAVDYQMDDVGPLPDDVELALFRVAQECMENVRKHSGSERTILHLHRRNGSVVLSVADEGRGISQSAERGIGLAGMRERIESVGGSLHLDSAPGQGLRVEAAVPLEATA
jgi:signal transduction histidine kinase